MSIRVRILTLALAVVVMVPAVAKAQMSPVSFGVKAGLNSASLSTDADEGDELDRRTGLLAGLFAGRQVNKNFGLQLEGLYSMRGAKFQEDEGEASINLNFIDVPLLARLGSESSSGIKYFVLTGPQVGFKVKGEVEFEGVTVDLEDDVKSTDFGWVFGAGLDSGRFTVDARFTLGLSDLDTTEDSAKNRTFAVTVGYRIK